MSCFWKLSFSIVALMLSSCLQQTLCNFQSVFSKVTTEVINEKLAKKIAAWQSLLRQFNSWSTEFLPLDWVSQTVCRFNWGFEFFENFSQADRLLSILTRWVSFNQLVCSHLRTQCVWSVHFSSWPDVSYVEYETFNRCFDVFICVSQFFQKASVLVI